jgi:hypothetical protein
MSTLLFLFGFLATGIIGAKTLGSFEVERSEQIGAEGFLFLLCVCASAISVLSYLLSAHRFHRYPGRIAGLIGGLVAAGTLCTAAAGTIYFGYGFAFSVTLALVLSSLTAFIWPLLTAKAQTRELP